MADPKYEGLPGIAYDQPDVYETTDLPEADQASDFFEDEPDPVERLHVSATEAYNAFKGKTLETKGIDFSDRISKRTRTGYDARSGEWEIVAHGTKETPLQKYQRLQLEYKELLEEVSEVEDAKGEPCTVTSTQIDQALKQLYDLRLEELLGSDKLNDPQGTQMTKLLTQLEQFKTKAAVKVEAVAPDDMIVYELKYRPEHVRLEQTTRLAELEHRLNKLETILGAQTDKLSRLATATQQNTLYDAAQLLSAKASILESTQLDHIEGRLTALQQKMNNVAEQKSANADDPEKDAKINELYEVVKKMDNFSDIVPDTINRLVALDSLHSQVSEFNKTLEHLKTVHTQINGDVQNNKDLLQAVQESFAVNLNNVNDGIQSLSARLNAVKTEPK